MEAAVARGAEYQGGSGNGEGLIKPPKAAIICGLHWLAIRHKNSLRYPFTQWPYSGGQHGGIDRLWSLESRSMEAKVKKPHSSDGRGGREFHTSCNVARGSLEAG